jgi:acyl-CoA-binding protein
LRSLEVKELRRKPSEWSLCEKYLLFYAAGREKPVFSLPAFIFGVL